MAIVVEEQKRGAGNAVSVVIWLVLLGVIGAAVYYIFFAQPDLVDVAAPAPPNFARTEQIAKLTLNVEEILSDARFQDLQPYVTPPETGTFGRANPFLSLEAPAPPPAQPRR